MHWTHRVFLAKKTGAFPLKMQLFCVLKKPFFTFYVCVHIREVQNTLSFLQQSEKERDDDRESFIDPDATPPTNFLGL